MWRLAGCISEPSFNTVHGPLIIQGVHGQVTCVFFFHTGMVNFSCTWQLVSFADASGDEQSTEVV